MKNQTSPTFQSRHPNAYSRVIVTRTFTPSISGKHYISLATLGNTKVYINDELVYDVEGKSANVYAILMGVAIEEQKQFDFVANELCQIRLEASTVEDPDVEESFMSKGLVFNFELMEHHLTKANLLQEAIDVADSSDVAIVFVGNTPTWETEGADRNTMALPRDGSLNRLITTVVATNPQTIVVNSTGYPITMPWLQDISAVLQACFPGQEAGYSIADVILGSACPGGKLPVTFPQALSDTPAFDNSPGNLEANFVEYKERIYVGYRHYDRKPETVLFPFGFGLLYTTFNISNVSTSSTSLEKGRSLTVTAHVTNTGARPGSKTVQVYIGPAMKERLIGHRRSLRVSQR
ncbi:unnamed protein product [Alternaria burnsii]|nr:unnamed protein product [Alternaria burnsii]